MIHVKIYLLKWRSPNSGSSNTPPGSVHAGGVRYSEIDAEKWVKEHTDVFHDAWYEIVEIDEKELKGAMSQ